MKNKILLMGLAIVLAAGVLGGATLAYFNDSDLSDIVDMSAGTLLINAGTSMIFGVEQETGDIYEIDVATGKDYKLFHIPGQPAGDVNYPNGLAFDRVNNRLYYADGGKLYFHSLSNGGQTPAGTLGGTIAGATFGQGYYWYVPNGTDDLYRVKFDADGKFSAADKELVAPDFTDNFANAQHRGLNFHFGDLALNLHDGAIYGSNSEPSNKRVFFAIDLRNNYEATEFTMSGQPNSGLQLAYAADGWLYGHTTHNDTGTNWWRIEVDKEDATASFYPMQWIGEHHFTDLASNIQNNWNPGDKDPARYYVTNTGTKRSYVRAKIVDYGWTKAGEELTMAHIDFELSNPSDWFKDGEYYYYKYILDKDEQSAPLAFEVKFDSDAGDEYQGAKFTMNVKFEAIQVTNGAAAEKGWPVGQLEPASNL